ncbi:hypothetical protein HK104_003469, partial [Borealophlyctis nickersoniae]
MEFASDYSVFSLNEEYKIQPFDVPSPSPSSFVREYKTDPYETQTPSPSPPATTFETHHNHNHFPTDFSYFELTPVQTHQQQQQQQQHHIYTDDVRSGSSSSSSYGECCESPYPIYDSPAQSFVYPTPETTYGYADSGYAYSTPAATPTPPASPCESVASSESYFSWQYEQRQQQQQERQARYQRQHRQFVPAANAGIAPLTVSVPLPRSMHTVGESSYPSPTASCVSPTTPEMVPSPTS